MLFVILILVSSSCFRRNCLIDEDYAIEPNWRRQNPFVVERPLFRRSFPRDVVCTRPQSGFPRDKFAGITSLGRPPSTTVWLLSLRRCDRRNSGPVSLSGTAVADFETTGSPSTIGFRNDRNKAASRVRDILVDFTILPMARFTKVTRRCPKMHYA